MTLVGWILTLRKLGDIFGVSGFHTWNFVMTVIMCVTWLVLFVLTAFAFWEGKIFISPPEDVMRDMLRLKIVDRQKDEDLEMGDRMSESTRVAEMAVVQPVDGAHMVEVHVETARQV